MTQQYDIHFCLISDQAAANLLPILDTQFKPKKAIFIVSEKMKEKAKYLAETFERKGVKVIQSKLDNELDFEQMEQQLIDLISQYEDENIALNVTGGTKLMAISAQQVFSMADKPIFYLDTDNNRIIFISKDEQHQIIPSKELNAKTELDIYLSAYGFKLINKKTKTNDAFSHLAEGFVKFYDECKNDIPLLNKYASLCDKGNLKVELDNKESRISSFTDLLEDLSDSGIIKYHHNQIDFKENENKDFLNGIWLEEYVYQAIKDLKNIDDIAFSVDIGNHKYQLNKNEYSQENKGNKNEFDIAFIAKNKLHIIECKTQKLEKKEIKAEDILYKLETLKDYGGLFTKKCLVSYYPIPDAVHNRAKELKIEIIQAKDIQRLKIKIQDWIAKK